MDYLVIGLLIGSLLAILGFFVREACNSSAFHGPGWVNTAGLSLMVSALFVWGVTGALAFADINDSRARLIVIVATVLALIGVILSVAFLRFTPVRSTVAERSADESSTVSIPDQAFSESATETDNRTGDLVDEAHEEENADETEEKTNSEDEPDGAETATDPQPAEPVSADYWLTTWLAPDAQPDSDGPQTSTTLPVAELEDEPASKTSEEIAPVHQDGTKDPEREIATSESDKLLEQGSESEANGVENKPGEDSPQDGIPIGPPWDDALNQVKR